MSNKYLIIKLKVKNKDGELITVIDKIFTAATNTLYRNNLDRRSEKKHIFKLFKDIIRFVLFNVRFGPLTGPCRHLPFILDVQKPPRDPPPAYN